MLIDAYKMQIFQYTHTDRPKKASEREEECADINDDMVADRLE